MDKKFRKVLRTILIIIFVMFSYGLVRGIYDANLNQKSSLFTIGITAYSMNPISAFGYKIGIHTSPEIQKKVNSIDRDLNEFDHY